MKDSIHQRLFKQQTVNSSIRRLKSGQLPSVDSLDSALLSVYNHETDLFNSKFEVYHQMKNSTVEDRPTSTVDDIHTNRQIYFHHPLKIGKLTNLNCLQHNSIFVCFVIGGISEKKSPHSVKLICIGQHTPITNPGYSRQPVDGNIFNY